MNNLAIIEDIPDTIDDKLSNFRVGNSKFLDETWDFTGFHNEPGLSPGQVQIRFAPIKTPNLKHIGKQFVIVHLVNNGFSTAKRAFDGFKRFYTFLDNHYPEISSLSLLNPRIVKHFYEFLLADVNKVTGNKMKRSGIKSSAQALKDIVIEGGTRGWDVPKESNWILPLYEELILRSKVCKTNFKTEKELYQVDTIKKIISCALKEDNIYTKAAIIIQSQTGIRLNELLSIKEGCIKEIDGEFKIEIWIRKTKSEVVRRLKPANELVVEVVKELEKRTKIFREKSKLPYLFLHEPLGKPIKVFNKSNWTRDILKPFVEKWDIEENGELIKLTSHYFRHVFATWAHRKGMPIQSILKMFDHESLRMTEVYTHITQKDIKENFEKLFTEDAIIAGVSVGRIKERLRNDNPFKGKTKNQIELIMEAMRINIRPNGVCLHHPLRNDPCLEDGDCIMCHNFVSPAICLPVHRLRVHELEKEMYRAEIEGNEIWYNKNKFLRDHILKIFIEPLESQLKLIEVE